MILQTYIPGFEPAVETPVVVEKPAPAPPPPKKGAVPRREMTPDENLIVAYLKRQVTTPPACWDKRFIRDVGCGGLITEKEAAQAWRLFQKYRRQISSPAKERLLEMAKHLAAPDIRKKNTG